MSELNPQHPNQLPEPAKDPFDEFSFDDLMQMDLDSPTAVVEPVAPTATTHTTPDVDFDSLFDFDDTTSASPHSAANTVDLTKGGVDNFDTVMLETGTVQPNPPITPDIADTDILPKSNHPSTAFDDTFTQLDNLNPTTPTENVSQPDFVATQPTPLPDTTAINPLDMVAGVGAAGITAATAAVSATDAPVNTANNTSQKPKSVFGGLFDKKEKTTKPAATKLAKETTIKPKKEKVVKTTTTTNLNPTPKKNNKLLPLILGLLVLGGLAAWLFSQIMDKAPEPKPVAVAPVAKPTPAPVVQPVSAVATVTATSTTTAMSAPVTTVVADSTPTATAVSTTTTTTTTETTAKSVEKNLIKPEDILAKPIPADPALAKEEMDKLTDQSARLAEQEKMMEDQLKMTKELSDKKAERIALLEQQVAQLEAQKAQGK